MDDYNFDRVSETCGVETPCCQIVWQGTMNPVYAILASILNHSLCRYGRLGWIETWSKDLNNQQKDELATEMNRLADIAVEENNDLCDRRGYTCAACKLRFICPDSLQKNQSSLD